MLTLTTRRPVTTTDGVMRLTRIAHRRLNTGQHPSVVLDWLRSASTADAFGREAVRVMDVLFAGRGCGSCGWTPADPSERVVGECVPGYHDIALVEFAGGAR